MKLTMLGLNCRPLAVTNTLIAISENLIFPARLRTACLSFTFFQ